MFKKRIAAFLIDFAITCLIFLLPFIVLNAEGILAFRFEYTLLPYVAVFCKDIFGRSIGKKLMRLKVTFDDAQSSKAGKIFRLIVRNIPLLLWPIEAIVAYTGNNKRLGDKFAGTTVEEIV